MPGTNPEVSCGGEANAEPPTYPEATFEAADASAWVVAVAQQRSRTAFAALFVAFAPRVKAYLLRRGAAPQTAEELTQDVFFAVWRKADQFDPQRATASAWIYTVARNLWIDGLRRERRPDDGRIDDPGLGPINPEEELEAKERVRQLRSAIQALPGSQIAVLRLAFFEDLTHVEIGQRLGVPLGTVKSRIRLATAHLSSALRETNEDRTQI